MPKKPSVYVEGYNRLPDGRNIWMFQATEEDGGEFGYSFEPWLDSSPSSRGEPDSKDWCGPDWVKSAPSIKRLREEAQPGDWVFLYQAQPNQAFLGLARMSRGGYAKGRNPSPSDFSWFDLDWWLRIPPLARADVAASPDLADMEFLHMRQGTIFRVAARQAELLLGLMRLSKAQQADIARAWGTRFAGGNKVSAAGQGSGNKRGGGAGYQQDVEARLALERYSVDRATRYYRHLGWRVEEFGKPFDLRCLKGRSELHVEVKGTTTDGANVRLTSNEVDDARNPNWRTDLFVVSDIELARGPKGLSLSGGRSLVIENWSPEANRLAPKEFIYSVPLRRAKTVK